MLFLLRTDWYGDPNNRFKPSGVKDNLFTNEECKKEFNSLDANAGFCNDESERIYWIIYVGY